MRVKSKGLKQETCYMCDEVATTKEHVPPKCLFPEAKDLEDKAKNYRVGLITVPSCPKHNNDKSSDDEYLLNVLSMNILSNDVGIRLYLTKIQRAWQRKPALHRAWAENMEPTNVPQRLGMATETAGSITVDRSRLEMVFEQCAKGLFYHEYGRKFAGTLDVYPMFLFSENEDKSSKIIDLNKILFEAYSLVGFKGENPQIFSYSFLSLGDTEKDRYVLRMVFYQNLTVMVFFNLKI